jgi:hypothetical protein
MSSNNEKPRNSMEMLIEAYLSTDVITKEETSKQPTQIVEGTNSREADVLELQSALRQTEIQLTKAGIELNQLPTDVSGRLFEKYQNIQLHLRRLIDAVENLLNS